jgi:hypothetical protein
LNIQRIIFLSIILITGFLFHVTEKCCADSPQFIIKPAQSKKDSNTKEDQTKPLPPIKRGFFVNDVTGDLIIREQNQSQSGRLVFDIQKNNGDLFLNPEELPFSLPGISLPSQFGRSSANKPRSLKTRNKMTVNQFTTTDVPILQTQSIEDFHNRSEVRSLPTSRTVLQERKKITPPALGFSEIEELPSRKQILKKRVPKKQFQKKNIRGVKLLPQIEVPMEQVIPEIPQTPKKKESSSFLKQSLKDLSKTENKNQQPIKKINFQQALLKKAPSVAVNAILTGIESEEGDEDFYDVEYLRTAAGLKTPTQKELEKQELLPLDEELANHGGSHLYLPEGDEFYFNNSPEHQSSDGSHAHGKPLRLPENWQKPKPLTGFQEFLGADPIKSYPGLQWFGEEGYQWEPRFTAYGSYEVFGMYFEEGNRKQNGVGHQLLIDLDLRITGTERAHVQFRPLGRKNSGGSFYQFNSPSGYDDNSTLIPDRYWVEGEIRSIFNDLINDSFTPLDYHFIVGKFPFALHNNILMSDDVHGIVINKNTLLIPPFSNMNVQFFYLFDDVDTALGSTADVLGTNLTADYQHSLLEATFAYVNPSGQLNDETYYLAGAWTEFIGQLSVTGRVLSKTGESRVFDDALLYVLESNYHTPLPESFKECTGFDHAVIYSTAFHATEGWVSISGGNFDRLRSTFEVDPLISISRGRVNDDTTGIALGYQLFANNDDESLIPEIAYEEPGNDSMYGISLRYLYKLGPRTFLDCRTIQTWSNNSNLERKGAFVSTTIIF